MNADFPAREAIKARIVGYAGLVLVAVSAALGYFGLRQGEAVLFSGLACAVLAPIVGAWGLAINRNCLSPRPPQPALALIAGLLLVGAYALLFLFLWGLAHMH